MQKVRFTYFPQVFKKISSVITSYNTAEVGLFKDATQNWTSLVYKAHVKNRNDKRL